MNDTIMYEHKEDMNKEEGEITDDDDVEIMRIEHGEKSWRYGSFNWKEKERHSATNYHHGSKKSRHATKTYHRPRPSQEPSPVSSPSNQACNRSESSVLRTYGHRSDGWKVRGSEPRERDGHRQTQRDHWYDLLDRAEHVQKNTHHTPNYGRLNDWRQRKFYSSSRSTQADISFARQNNEGKHKMDPPLPEYFRRSPETGVRYSRPGNEDFRKREEMESDYNRLLQFYAEVQDELKRIGHSPSPHKDDSVDHASGSSTATKAAKAKAGNPTMSISEAVSDVSSDELNFSQEQQHVTQSDQILHNAKPAFDADETSAVADAATDEVQVDEEDDLDVLELRRLALESAALRKYKSYNESEEISPGSSQSSPLVATSLQTVTEDKSQSECENKTEALKLKSESIGSVLKVTAPDCSNVESESNLNIESKSHTDKHTLSSHSKRSSETRNISADRPCSSEKESFGEKWSDATSSSERTRKEKPKEKENTKSGHRKAKPKESSVRSRPLPFAPTRIETIRLKSLSTRSSNLTDVAKRVQRRARQTSVARQLLPKGSATPSTNRKRSERRKSADHERTSEDRDAEKKLEERRLEMNKILVLQDQKEQVLRFLKLISYEVSGSASSSKTLPKAPATTDNYEEVEMDIDSGDDLEDILRKSDIQIAAPPVPPVRSDLAEPLPSGTETLMAPASWVAPPYIPTPLTLCSHAGTFAVPPPPLPQVLPPLPPVEEPPVPPPPPPLPPEDVPPPPPPPGLDEAIVTSSEESGTDNDQRISRLGQFFQAAFARQESIQKSAALEKAVISSSSPEQSVPEASLLSPEVKKLGEDMASELSSPYSPSKPLEAVTPQKSEDAEEEDEALMREQLLRSMLKRRKEIAEGKTLSASSKESSPTQSGTSSPQRPVLTKTTTTSVCRSIHNVHKPHPSFWHMEFPVHKPVVVSLNESSSEDEDDHKTGEAPVSSLDIDSFLKAQRKTADNLKQPAVSSSPVQPPDRRVVQVKEQQRSQLQEQRTLKQKETELSSLKRLLLTEELKLKALTTKLNHFTNEKKMADSKVSQLKKQLQVAEKLAAHQANLVISNREQIKQLKDSTQKKRDLILTSTEETMSLGRKLLGPSYVLGSCPSPHAQELKRKVQTAHSGSEMSVTFHPSEGKRKRPNPRMTKTLSQVSGDADRHDRYVKLQQQKAALEQEIQVQKLRLQQYKKKEQLAVAVTVQDGQRCVMENIENVMAQPPEGKRHERLPSLEAIKLEPVEMATVRRSRRSLLDMTQSPKPTLIMGDRQQTLQGQGEGNTLASRGEGVKRETAEFKMPSGSQLSNLCRIQREKMEKILATPVYQPLKLLSNLSPPCSPIPELKVVMAGCRQTKEKEEADLAKLPYTSPLLLFRAYRFSPYYRTKEGLTLPSTSFSHKLNPNRVLCRYDMQGTCKDEHCTWQHAEDYKLTDKEILMDLVSYCPSMAGITPDTPLASYPSLIGDYVDQLLAQHKGKMTTDDLCLLLTARVNDAAHHARPHTMFFERRPWRPCASESGTFSLSIASEFQKPSDSINGVVKQVGDMDSIVDVDDVRYFAADKGEGGEVQDMEGAVLATPTDTSLWLRLAYSKLSNPTRSSEECLNQALNVLSRGLESNKDSSALWVHYLSLFRRHPDSETEFVDMCGTALACAPCYDLWWLLLEASPGFKAKDTVCNRTLEFLKEKGQVTKEEENPKKPSFGSDKVLSHQTLEMLLYKVQLNIHSGRFKTALNFLQAVVGIRDNSHREKQLVRLLTHGDQCVVWMCLAHLVEFQSLPSSLYDPANQNPGRIKSKDRLYIPWQSRSSLSTAIEPLLQYMAQAVTLDLDKPLDDCTSPQYVLAVHNLATLLCTQGRHEQVCHILTNVLQSVPHLEEVWLMLADTNIGRDDLDTASQVFVTARSTIPFSAKIHYHSALVDQSHGRVDEALELLEQFVLHHYDISPEERGRADPNNLFSHLLGLDPPLRKKIPPLKEEARPFVTDKGIYLWLCFCLLQELQGETGEVINTYELALSATTGAADLSQLWKCYVQFLYRQHCSAPPHISHNALQQLQEALMRSVITAPTLLLDPFPRQFQPQPERWRDLSHVTSLVEFYVELLSPDVVASALHTFCDLMPDNIALITRCVEMAVEDRQIRRARSLCASAIYDKVANLHLWKLALALAHQDGTPREVERLYIRAVTAMPLSVSLWKDFLLFEVSQENTAVVRTLLTHCHTLGLNIQGYVATIAGSS